MSAETAHVIYTICVLALGFTLHVGYRAFMDYHDARKNHEIHRLQWENDQLKRQLTEAPAPLTEEAPSPAPIRMDTAPRKRRSPAKAEIKPVQPRRIDATKVPSAIPQADLGRMQAQLAAYGRCRTVSAGGKHS